MDTQFEAQLIECLDALAQGQLIDQILARFPQDAPRLRPILQTAAGLSTLRQTPSEAQKIQSRQKFLAQADQLRRSTVRRPRGFLPRLAVGFLAAALFAAVLGTGAVAASGTALPGDPLYGLKRSVENVQLSTASSPTARQELQTEFEQRRLGETETLLKAGRESTAEFSGPIEALQPDHWIIAGVTVLVDKNTVIEGMPRIKRLAEVHGVTGPGGLRATAISIESGGDSEISPTPSPTTTPEATRTPAEPATETPEPASEPRSVVAPVEPTETATTMPKPDESAQPTSTSNNRGNQKPENTPSSGDSHDGGSGGGSGSDSGGGSGSDSGGDSSGSGK